MGEAREIVERLTDAQKRALAYGYARTNKTYPVLRRHGLILQSDSVYNITPNELGLQVLSLLLEDR